MQFALLAGNNTKDWKDLFEKFRIVNSLWSGISISGLDLGVKGCVKVFVVSFIFVCFCIRWSMF